MAAMGRQSILESWKVFLKGLIHPLVLIMILSAILLTIFSYSTENNAVKTFLSILAMLTTGVLGAKLLSYYETGKLEEKGKSAIRSLKLMMNDLTKLEKRVRSFLPKVKSSKERLEEIVDRVVSLQEQTIASIQNWTDVFPDADIKPLIGELSRAKEEAEIIEIEMKKTVALLDELERDKEKDKAEIERLEKQLEQKDSQLSSTRKNISQISKRLETGLLSGLDVSSTSLSGSAGLRLIDLDSPVHKLFLQCKNCGKPYIPRDMLTDVGYCPECRNLLEKG